MANELNIDITRISNGYLLKEYNGHQMFYQTQAELIKIIVLKIDKLI